MRISGIACIESTVTQNKYSGKSSLHNPPFNSNLFSLLRTLNWLFLEPTKVHCWISTILEQSFCTKMILGNLVINGGIKEFWSKNVFFFFWHSWLKCNTTINIYLVYQVLKKTQTRQRNMPCVLSVTSRTVKTWSTYIYQFVFKGALVSLRCAPKPFWIIIFQNTFSSSFKVNQHSPTILKKSKQNIKSIPQLLNIWAHKASFYRSLVCSSWCH